MDHESIDSKATDDAYEALMTGIRNRVTLKELEKLYTTFILEANGGNKVHAAKQLGCDRRTLQRWGKKAA